MALQTVFECKEEGLTQRVVLSEKYALVQAISLFFQT